MENIKHIGKTDEVFVRNTLKRKAILAQNLQVARKTIGMTQQALLETTGLTRATISKIESGIGDPRLSTITTLATALDISPLLLLITREELYAMVAVGQSIKDSVGTLPPEAAVALKFVNPLTATPKMIKDAIQIAVDHLDPRGNSEIAGIAIGTANKPGEGSKIGQALGKALDLK